MSDELRAKLKTLPASPGVYFHKNVDGEVIYVGKAAVLKNRVRHYFQSQRGNDTKTRALVADIVDTDWVETESEIDALFLESEMVKRYMPRYNVLLRDDKSQLFIRVDEKSEWPTVTTTRNPSDDRATYIGPFYNGAAIKKALRYLRRVFPYFVKTPDASVSKLEMQIGLNPDMSKGRDAYIVTLRQLIGYLKGNRKSLVQEIERDMKQAAREERFEDAARLRNRLNSIRHLQSRVCFGDKEYIDISKDRALSDLRELLGLESELQRIEGFDISHMSGTNVVASMVVFTNGVSNRAEYRKFKTRHERNNDFANMNETLERRLSERNIKGWGMPDLLLIDGGKGQLDAALTARDKKGLTMPMIGLAKKQEQIIFDNTRSGVVLSHKTLQALGGYSEHTEQFTSISLPHSTHIIKLLQRIRDESHRFAVSYHTILKTKGQTRSVFDDMPGIGPVTKKLILQKFGSAKGVARASDSELATVIGEKKMQIVRQYIQQERENGE